jgi:hypothetical protein
MDIVAKKCHVTCSPRNTHPSNAAKSGVINPAKDKNVAE